MYMELNYRNELYHHGIKGMKWGIRRFQNSDGSYTSAGKNRYGYDKSLSRNKNLIERYRMRSGQKMAYKLNNMSAERKRRMSARQKTSYSNAKQYWEARALGKKTPRRSIIRRSFDKKRADSFEYRMAKQLGSNIGTKVGKKLGLKIGGNVLEKMAKKPGDKASYYDVIGKMYVQEAANMSYKDIVVSSARETGQYAITDELLNKIFGHY